VVVAKALRTRRGALRAASWEISVFVVASRIRTKYAVAVFELDPVRCALPALTTLT
jgi:hypothetical protein